MVKRGHILFIVENNPIPYDRRVWGEAVAAKELGYDVSIICPANHYQEDNRSLIDGIRIYRHYRPIERSGKWPMAIEYMNAILWELLIALRVFIAHPFHVIHGANPPDHIFLIAMLFKPFGVKFIFDHHDITPETYVAKYGKKGVLYQLLLWMERLTFKSANLVVSTNESYKKVAMQRGGKRENDIIVVRNGPNLSAIPDVQPNYGLMEGFKYLVGYVGIIGQQEGIENLLKAVDFLVRERQRTDIKYAVVGSGPNLKNIMHEAAEMGLGKYVHFYGHVPNKTLYEILMTSAVCVNPEFSNEFTNRSTMIKIMEYMTFRKPIVQFHTIEGEVTAGEAAIYIRDNDVKQFADALLALLNDPERRERMGMIGRRRIEDHLRWEIQKRNLRTAYQQVFSE